MAKPDTAMKGGWNFGAMIRALRLGYGLLPGSRKGLLRISPAVGGILCEFRPMGLIPHEHRADGEHYVWWEKNGGKDIFGLSPFLSGLKDIKQPFSIVLGEHGEVVKS